MGRFTFGVDIGGTAVKVGLFSDTEELISQWQIPTRLVDHGAQILSDVKIAAEGILDGNGLTWADVAGIGLAVPGPVTEDGIVPLAVNLGWTDVNVRDEMKKLTGIERIAVGNDAKTAALGEYRKGGWEAYHSMVLITLGTAVGGAVILDGQVLSGAFGAAGELSHIQVDPHETEPCACGRCGHLQQYVSTEAILKRYRQRCGCSAEVPNDLSVKDIFDAARSGERTALETIDEMAEKLGSAMAAVSCVIDPELYLIGGGISKAGEFLLEKLRAEFKKQAVPVSAAARIEAAKMGNDAGIWGAMYLVRDFSADRR